MRKAVLAAILLQTASGEWLTWAPGEAHSTQEYLDGYAVRTLAAHGLVVSVRPYMIEKDFAAAEVYVINDSSGPVNVFPDQCALDFPGGQVLAAIPASALIEKIRGDVMLAAFFSMLAGQQQNTTQTSSTTLNGLAAGPRGTATFSGTATTTTTGPDWEARRRAERLNLQLAASARGEIERIDATALKANTVRPGGSLSGIVWWPKTRALRQADSRPVIHIALAGHVYRFPLRP